MHFKAFVPGREEIEIVVKTDGHGKITASRLTGIGGPEVLSLLHQWRPRLQGPLAQVELPRGNSTGAMLLREVLLKARGEWHYPFNDHELCHCRAVPTHVVDAAVVTGAHTPGHVSRWTSASTACGTCHCDVEAILSYRMDKDLHQGQGDNEDQENDGEFPGNRERQGA